MNANNIICCKKCYHFSPVVYIREMIHPASCEHPECFKERRYQDVEGIIKKERIRIKNIIDFNADGSCSLFEPFEWEKIKKKMWIFSYYDNIKVKI